MASLVTSRWHWITHDKAGAQIYDWTQDPLERNDLIQTPAGVAAAQELSNQLAEQKKTRR